jgi:hypothetical protein
MLATNFKVGLQAGCITANACERMVVTHWYTLANWYTLAIDHYSDLAADGKDEFQSTACCGIAAGAT